MKTVFFIILAALTIIGSSTALSTKEGVFTNIFDKYAFIANGVDNVSACDSLLKGLSPKYRKLQNEQYKIYMNAGNFNLPAEIWICDEIISDLGLKRDDHKDFVICIFRMSVIFRIIDKLNNKQLPSKEKIVSDFTVKYHFQG